jgi:hypothetical protein
MTSGATRQAPTMTHNLRPMAQRNDRGIFVTVECVHVAGDYVAGAVLSQIIFWFKPKDLGEHRAWQMVNGEKWLVRSYGQWAEDTAISKRQLSRALHALEAQGLVRIKDVHLSGYHKLGVQPITEVIEQRLGVRFGTPAVTDRNTPATERDTGHVGSALAIKKELLRSLENKNILKKRSLRSHEELADEIGKKAIEEQGKGKTEMLTEEHKKKTINAKDLAEIWHEHHARKGERFSPTSRDYGMFKRLAHVLGDDSGLHLQKALSEWGKFSCEVALPGKAR